MSTINVSNLILTLQQKIDSSSSESDILYYSKAMQQLKTGNVYVVTNISQLPTTEENIGSLYQVLSEDTVYFSNSFGWIPIYKSSISTIFTWGENLSQQLGDGTCLPSCSPVREFCSATDWCQVSAGGSGAAALKTSGELWSWGLGSCGRLGNGSALGSCSPVREICSATDWCQASRGGHTSAIKASGQLWVWGSNQCGALGDGTTVNKCSPVREICSATDWCQVSAGVTRTAAIKTSGQLWAWGSNVVGQLGDGTVTLRCSPVREICSATDWCQVSAGGSHTAAIKTSGQLWAWGRNSSAAIGDGTSTNRCSPVREFCSATNWCQVSASSHTAAIKTSNELWSWGLGCCGRLGDGTSTNRCSPVREFCSATNWCQVSASSHTAAILVRNL